MTEIRKNYIRPLDIKHGQVEMAHGAGGRAMAQLIDELFAKYLASTTRSRPAAAASSPRVTMGLCCRPPAKAGW